MVKVFNRITDIRNSHPPFPLLLIKCTLFPAMVYWDHLHLLLFSLRHGDKISPLNVWLKSSWQWGCVWCRWLRACCMHAPVSHGGDRKSHVSTTFRAQHQLHSPPQGQGQELWIQRPEKQTAPSPYPSDWTNGRALQRLSLADVMAKPGGVTRAAFAKSTPKVLSTLFKMLLGQFISLQLPATSVSAFLLSDPTAQPESSRWSLHPPGLPEHKPTNCKRNRALPPKAAQERGNCHRERFHLCHTAQRAFGCLAILPFSAITAFCPFLYLNMKWRNLDFSPWQGWFSHQGQPSWEIWFLCSQGLVNQNWLEREISLQQKGWRTACPRAGGRTGQLSFTIYLETLQKCCSLWR